MEDVLKHHGILGQKWGKRNGPPYPLGGGDYTQLERKKISEKRHRGNSIYNKKHFDEVLKKDSTTLSTLSYRKDRLEGADMFFANHNFWDKQQYMSLFNSPVPQTLYDDQGKKIGIGIKLKYRIDTKLKSDMKVASEDTSADAFMKLYKNDRDFYNFVTDPKRMQEHFVDDKYKFKGYSEARKTLNKMRQEGYKPTSKDLQTVYRMFNYVIPSDGKGDARKANDVLKQRTKLFAELKKQGYGAILDTNDAIYGGFKAKHPVIVFDMEQVIPDSVYQTKMSDRAVADAALAFRKLARL